MAKLTVVTQERASVLHTGHIKEPEDLFKKELGTIMPGLLCIWSLSSLYVLPCTDDGFHQEWGVKSEELVSESKYNILRGKSNFTLTLNLYKFIIIDHNRTKS